VTSSLRILERVLQILLGLVLTSLVVMGPRTMWGLLGAIPLFTGLTGHCPAHRLLRGPPAR